MKENKNRIHKHTLFLHIKKKNHTKIKLKKKTSFYYLFFSYLKYQYLDVGYFFQYLFDLWSQ